MNTQIEHVNFTVSDADATAKVLAKIFGWQIRWSGPSLDTGYTVHLGEPDIGKTYVALYTPPKLATTQAGTHLDLATLNHIGVVVEDLDKVERKVIDSGFTTFNHANYEPGKRFYFLLDEGLEFEVICYH